MFEHLPNDYETLERETIDGVRYYTVPGSDTPRKLVSITSVISHFNREKFREWRQRVGEEEANKITRKATSRGTDMHTLVEHYLKNEELPSVQPLSEFLFKQAKPELKRINNIHALEQSLFSLELGVAGTVDCIAEFDNELAIIDFKTSGRAKPREWIDGYFVQCAAYACMLYEMTGQIIDKFVIIMSCEDGDVVVYQEYDKAKYIKLLGQYIRDFIESKIQEYV
jgi:genome maintenance exonuclease 1